MNLNPEIQALVDETVQEYPLMDAIRIKGKILKELDQASLCGVIPYRGCLYAIMRVIVEEMRLDRQRLAQITGELCAK